MSDSLLTSKDGEVYWISLNRPERANAINVDMWKKLKQQLDTACEDSEVRMIALTGSGKYFTAGEDLNDLDSSETFNSSLNLFLDVIRPVFETIIRAPKAVISVVNGAAIGVGVELVFASDLAIAHKDSYFMLSQAKLGVGPSLSLSLALPVLGKKRLFYMVTTGKKVSAKEALEWGVVNELYDGEATEVVKRIAQEISKVPKTLTRLTKEILARQLYLLDYTSSFRDIGMFVQSEDARKGIRSFISNKKSGS